jgi:hypothetical protein
VISGHSAAPLRATDRFITNPAHDGRVSAPEDLDVAAVGGNHALLPIHDENRVAERIDELRQKGMDLVEVKAVRRWIR